MVFKDEIIINIGIIIQVSVIEIKTSTVIVVFNLIFINKNTYYESYFILLLKVLKKTVHIPKTVPLIYIAALTSFF